MSSDQPELGVILGGAVGRQGGRHAEAVAQVAGMKLACLVDVPAKVEALRAMADQFHCRWAVDWEEAVADPRTEAAIVAAPNVFHRPMAVAALDAGKHIFIEKPIAHSLEDGCAILEAAFRAQRRVGTGFNYRFRAPVKKAFELYQAGVIGTVHTIRAEIGHAQFLDSQPPNFTRKELAGGGALLDLGVHPIDLARRVLGPFDRVRAWSHQGRLIGTDVEEEAGATFHTGDDRVFTVAASWLDQRPHLGMRFEMMGRTGRIVIDLADCATHLIARTARGWQEETFRFPYPDGCWGEQLHAFAVMVRGGDSAVANGGDGCEAVRLVFAAYESARGGGDVVNLRTFPLGPDHSRRPAA